MIPLHHGLLLGTVIFSIGLYGVLTRSNLLLILMSLELMLCGAIFNFIFVSHRLGLFDGQMIALFIMVIAAAEVTIGLALAIVVYRKRRSLDIELWDSMKE